MATGEPHLEMRPLLCIFNSQLGLGCITQTNKFEVLKCLFIFWHFDKISIYQSAKHINLLLWMCNGLNNPSIKKYQPLPEVKYLNERPVSIFSVREQPPSKALNQNKLLSVSQIPVGATKKKGQTTCQTDAVTCIFLSPLLGRCTDRLRLWLH